LKYAGASSWLCRVTLVFELLPSKGGIFLGSAKEIGLVHALITFTAAD
jgi:hypothetical protein